MAKYSLETKLEAVRTYLEGTESFKIVAEKHRVDVSLLKQWVANFREHGVKAFQKAYTNYSVEFKMDVLNYIEETGASIREVSSKFNIPSHTTVRKWKDAWDQHGIDALQPKKKERPAMKKKVNKNQPAEGSEEALRAEIEQLRMENAYLKKLQALIQEKEKLQTKTKRK